MNLLFVSLSDLHLGEEDSVLTNLAVGKPVPQPRGPGPCMLALVNYLHAVKYSLNEGKTIPFLILNGDILELATSTYPISTTYFRLLLAELAKHNLFDRVVYLPGNHDHGLWTIIRDTHFIESLRRRSIHLQKLNVEHRTQLSIPCESTLLTLLASNLPMQIIGPPILVANPSFRLQSWQGHDYLFHHGHLFENVYKFLSLLRDRLMKDASLKELTSKPLRERVGELEQENWPWIDFVWSGFARAGRVGHTMEDIYELLSKPQGASKLIERVGNILRTELDIKFVPEGLEDDIFRFIITKALKKGGVGSDERADREKPPFEGNEDLKEMIRRFLSHYMTRELLEEGLHPVTDRSCFVFGHTHKPFLAELKDDDSSFGTTTIINSGGWVIESEKYWPNHGPGIVLGTNAGDVALVECRLDKKPGTKIQKKGDWDETLGQLSEHQQLALAISNAVGIRRSYFRRRVRKTEKILENLYK